MKDKLLAWNQAFAIRAKTDWVQTKQRFKGLFHKATGTSTFGQVVQVAGLVFFIHGVYLIYPPASWIMGGILVLLVGEKL